MTAPPLGRRDVAVLAGAYVVLTAAYLAIGWVVVRWWERSSLGRSEAEVNRWLEEARTDRRNDLAEFGSALSNTETKVVLVLALLPLMLWMYRRWHDWALVTVGLLFEVSVFGTTAKLIGRERPPVEQLDGAPTNSWPSGHIAAAVVFYGALAIVIRWNNKSRRSRAGATAIAVVAPSIVIASRLYQGMHYVSDAVGGVILGVLTLLLVRHLIMRSDSFEELPVRSDT